MDVLPGASKANVSSIPETSTSASTTGISSLAHRMASSRPKPLPAPVITATRAVRLFISESLGSDRRPWRLAIASDGTTFALQQVVTCGLSSIDVENLPCHKSSTIEVEHRVYDIRHISHPTHWMKCRQCLMGFGRMHWGLDYSR